jgi:hypothetical protein
LTTITVPRVPAEKRWLLIVTTARRGYRKHASPTGERGGELPRYSANRRLAVAPGH